MDVTAWVAIVGPITTLAGGLGGYWLAGRNEEARDRRAAGREAAARRAALGERLEEDRHTFQRDTLLELQDELQRYVQVTADFVLRDYIGTEVDQPPGLSFEEVRQVRVSVQRLQTRVLHPELRQAVADFMSQCDQVRTMQKDDAAARVVQLDKVVSDRYEALIELLGARLRHELDRRGLAELPPGEDSG